jgi:predicted naringenin-chalcone synthase
MSTARPTTSAALVSLATAHPPFRMPRAEWLEIADTLTPPEVDRALLTRLAERSGIETRWCAAFEEGRHGFYRPNEVPGTAERMMLWSRAARALSVDAAQRALTDAARAGITAGSITHLVTASCTGFAAPGIDAFLIETLGLSRSVSRLNVGFMGCHAAVNALAAARATVLANPNAVVLVALAEVSSAHFHHTTRLDQLVANTLFADGGAAMIVAAESPATQTRSPALATIVDTHSTLIPHTSEEMAWHIGDRGFEMTLGASVPAILEREIRAWVERALATHGLGIRDVAGWAIHPGGPRVIDAVAAALELPESAVAASRAILRDYGNMSSVTLPFIFERLARDRAAELRHDTRSEAGPTPWVGLAFGPGLAGEMIVCHAARI